MLAIAIALLTFKGQKTDQSGKQNHLVNEISRTTSNDDHQTSPQIEIEKLKSQLKQQWSETTYINLLNYYAKLFLETKEKNLSNEIWKPEDLQYLENSSHSSFKAIAFQIYLENNQIQKAEELFEAILKDSKTPPEITNLVLDRISQYHFKNTHSPVAIEWFYRVIKLRTNDDLAYRWYGFLLEILMETSQWSEARKVLNQCLEELRKYTDHRFPVHCYQQSGVLNVFESKLTSAIEDFSTLYSTLVKSWKNEKQQTCTSSKWVPLALDNIASQKRMDSARVMIPDLLSEVQGKLKYKCSKQKWPHYIKPVQPEELEGNYSYQVAEWNTNPLHEMRCFQGSAKSAVLYRFSGVSVMGPRKLIFESGSEGKFCHLYTPSFPFVNSQAQPRYSGLNPYDYGSLPIKYLDRAIILHFMDVNYYHFTVEVMSQLVLVFQKNWFQNSNIPILVTKSKHAEEIFELFMLHDRFEEYKFSEYRYHIKEAFVVDWAFSDEENSMFAPHHPEDYYVPPALSLHLLRNVIHTSVLGEETSKLPRDLVIFVHRAGKSNRQILDHESLYQRLSVLSESFGMKFVVHGNQTVSVLEQIVMFSRAAVVIGVHGAGLSNIVYCRSKTFLIEIPVQPTKVSVYSRLASSLNLNYWTLPSFEFYHFDSLSSLSTQMIDDAELTLYHILQKVADSV